MLVDSRGLGERGGGERVRGWEGVRGREEGREGGIRE